MMIRLRVTDLDAWRRYVEPERPEFEISLEQFLSQLRREVPETPEMQCGSAFHEILEHAVIGEMPDPFKNGEWKFQFDIDCTIPMPVCRETLVEKTYTTPSGNVLLRGKLDGHDGSERGEIIDYKLTFSGFDAERYADSMQWRAYIDATGASRMVYRVFEGNRKGNIVWIYDYHELTMWTYPELTADVQRRVSELAEFVAAHVPSLIVEEITA